MEQTQTVKTNFRWNVLYEVKKIIVGRITCSNDYVALLARGHILVEGVPVGEDDGDQDPCRSDWR